MTAPLSLSHYSPDGSGPPLRPDITVGQELRNAAADAPHADALVEGLPGGSGRRWTYAELLGDAEQCAQMLLDYFEPGERFGMWAHNLPEWVIMEYGAALAGLTLVTLNPSLQSKEAAYVLRQSKSSGVFVVPEVRGNPIAGYAAEIQAELPDLRHILRLDELHDLMSAATADRELPHVSGSDPAQIQYTSGTTGFPKGVVLRHHSVVDNARIWTQRIGIETGASWISPMPLFHTGGCVLGVLGALACRSKLVVPPGFEPGLFLELIEREQGQFCGAVPTMLIAAMEHADFTSRDLSSWSGVVSGGSQVPEALVNKIEEALGVDFTIVYGQTECSPVLTNTFPNDSAEDKGTTIGPPIGHVELKVVDPESLDTVAVGAQGELWARGFFTMIEYFENPEATAETLLPDGWLRTGDLATMDERGYCRIVGRLKDMVIRGGENLFPVEIEEVLMKHPAVAEVAVVGLPDERWGEVLGAFLRLDEQVDAPTVSALRDYIRTQLSPQKTPAFWYAVDSFPLTGSGKIQKFALRTSWEAGEHEASALS